LYACMYVCMYVCMCVCIYNIWCVYIYMVYVYVYLMCTHTHTHTYTYYMYIYVAQVWVELVGDGGGLGGQVSGSISGELLDVSEGAVLSNLALSSALPGTQFTCFTSAKVQILTAFGEISRHPLRCQVLSLGLRPKP
jgi:hypothetical protein